VAQPGAAFFGRALQSRKSLHKLLQIKGAFDPLGVEYFGAGTL
jgi:hypothetical protein